MSRIGKLPVLIPDIAKVTIEGQKVTASGPKGELSYLVNKKLKVTLNEKELVVTKKVVDDETLEQYGLTRTLIANMVKGVTIGFTRELEINGIGYRASVSGQELVLSLGYSHPINYQIPEDIKINVEKNNITISGNNKQKVGQIAAEIRAFRSPEPYKGKGIKYKEEIIRRKSGKTGAK